ncbi:MFS transporter [Streptomyces sp. NPDC007088]|uniref:MFS transporter n=1 Tax=Streptomyces sp. NPDC007088 TaxID=3364773 RepID=UPI0036D090DC
MAATSAEGTPPPTDPKTTRTVIAGSVGNFIEHIDVGLYGYLAPVMADSFFPSHNHTVSLLSTYGVFALGFLVQPVGGLIFGRIGDRVGRRTVLITTIVLMGVCTTCIGLLPGYGTIGLAAPALLLLLRMLQGVANGGEYGSALTFLIEYAGRGRRGLYIGFASMGVFGGLLVGAGMSSLTSALLTQEQMSGWGWRLPFLTALPLAALGLLLRSGIDDTPEFLASRREGRIAKTAPVMDTLRTQWRVLLMFTAGAMTNAVLSYVWVTYLPQWLDSEGGLSHSAAFASNAVALAVYLPFLVLAGWLSDRIGRKPMLLTGCVCVVVLVPLSFLIAHGQTFGSALLAQLVYLVPEFFIAVPLAAWLPEMVPTEVRVTTTALGFNVPFSLFSGTAPLVATALVGWTGSLYSVCLYLGGLAVISFLVILFGMRETAHGSLAAGAVDTGPAPAALATSRPGRTDEAPSPIPSPQKG